MEPDYWGASPPFLLDHWGGPVAPLVPTPLRSKVYTCTLHTHTISVCLHSNYTSENNFSLFKYLGEVSQLEVANIIYAGTCK